MKAAYDRIGLGYNQTRKADPYLTQRLLHYLAPESGKRYLDIGCGTGNYTVELQKKGLTFIGIDPSVEMLKIAQAKSTAVDWRQGSAEEVPLEDSAVSGITAFLTLHHWTDLIKGFAEMYRVLKPGWKMVIFTSAPEQITYCLNWAFSYI